MGWGNGGCRETEKEGRVMGAQGSQRMHRLYGSQAQQYFSSSRSCCQSLWGVGGRDFERGGWGRDVEVTSRDFNKGCSLADPKSVLTETQTSRQ